MFINLTIHPATKEQKLEGVVDSEYQGLVKSLLTFEMICEPRFIKWRAERLATLAKKQRARKAMIGGAPYFMKSLEKALVARDIEPVYSFSQRVSTEVEVDGVVTKTSSFKHLGWMPVVK
jgi:hypothetical protein